MHATIVMMGCMLHSKEVEFVQGKNFMSRWRVVDTGIGSAQQNMNSDQKFLDEIDSDSLPLIHFYEWEGLCATYGYFTKPFELLHREGVELWNLQLGRRPTGGGLIFHLCDLAFSVILPASHPHFSLNTLENYAFINEAVIRAIKCFSGDTFTPSLYNHEATKMRGWRESFCMAKPTQYDVMLAERKVGGAAQRRTKKGFLHQGSISLALPPHDFLKGVLLPESKIFEAMQEVTYTLLEGETTPKQLQEARGELRRCLIESLRTGS